MTSDEFITEDCTCNEDYYDAIKLLRFFNSHFDEDFEEKINYYEEKFGYK